MPTALTTSITMPTVFTIEEEKIQNDNDDGRPDALGSARNDDDDALVAMMDNDDDDALDPKGTRVEMMDNG